MANRLVVRRASALTGAGEIAGRMAATAEHMAATAETMAATAQDTANRTAEAAERCAAAAERTAEAAEQVMRMLRTSGLLQRFTDRGEPHA